MNSICAPALLYLILSLFAILIMISQNFQILSILVKIFFVAIWTWFLNFLCSQGYTTVSWFLVILPIIFFILFSVFAYEIFKKLTTEQINEIIRQDAINNKRYNR